MPTSIDKLLAIFECIEESCTSSVKIFDEGKGHSSRAVGFAAYEERQQKMLELAETRPDVLEFLCKRSKHNYFKFEGKTIKIISSSRNPLNKNVFDRNAFEREDDEFGGFDPLIRIIYKADYDLVENTANLLECNYLEVDRNSHQVIHEINLLELAHENGGVITSIQTEEADAVELPAGGLLFTRKEHKKSSSEDS